MVDTLFLFVCTMSCGSLTHLRGSISSPSDMFLWFSIHIGVGNYRMLKTYNKSKKTSNNNGPKYSPPSFSNPSSTCCTTISNNTNDMQWNHPCDIVHHFSKVCPSYFLSFFFHDSRLDKWTRHPLIYVVLMLQILFIVLG
jgi:hypothetical protein